MLDSTQNDTQELDKLNDTSTAPPPASDPMSSLRAAALQSRKRKTKPDDGAEAPLSQSQPQRAHTSRQVALDSDAMQLDYGGPEDDVEDGQLREEGEISEEEHTPLLGEHSALPNTRNRATISIATEGIQASTTTSSVAGNISEPVSATPTSISPHVSFYGVDAKHVRPGLAMTQAEYDTAKDIVLDLLGWGVHPEYLLVCGLSREVVYYVFHELNLRLPANLDTTGLLPYPPPGIIDQLPTTQASPTSTQAPASPVPRVDALDNPLSDSASHPTNPQNVASPATPKGGASRPSLSHPSLPPKPTAAIGPAMNRVALSLPNISTPLGTLSPHAPPFVPSSSSETLTPSLTDIEAQRRQELLARKAAQASRRAKSAQQSSEQDAGARGKASADIVEMDNISASASFVPHESIDAFLNSIGSVPESLDVTGKLPITDVPHHVASPEHVPMEVDAGEPDFRDRSETPTGGGIGPPLAQPIPVAFNRPRAMGGLGTDDSRNGIPRSMSASSGGSGTVELPPDSPASAASAASTVTRRGTKRPVAADFVDLEPVAKVSRSGEGEPSSGPSTAGVHPLARRKVGSFAGLSGMRRCVIDVSDDEDGDDSEGDSPPAASIPTQPAGGRLGIAAVSGLLNGGSRSGASSPATLAAKEKEIQKMREMIAKREQQRLKKAVLGSGQVTANASPQPPSSPAPNGAMRSASGSDDEAESFARADNAVQPPLPAISASRSLLAASIPIGQAPSIFSQPAVG